MLNMLGCQRLLENMVSEETGAFIKEHLENCLECTAELEAMKAGTKVERIGNKMQNNLDTEVLKPTKAIPKRFRKMTYRVAAVITAAFIVACVLLHFFPVYRILEIGPMTMGNFYNNDQIAKALYIGSASDRIEAQAVLRLADKVFNDIRHTRAENKEEYGLLARYATHSDIYGDVAFNEHSLELWSAHLGTDEGWIWVNYSSETFNHDGSTACGSWRIPSLWKVEKNDNGEWTVVQIYEHP